jgi:hypothetical protein
MSGVGAGKLTGTGASDLSEALDMQVTLTVARSAKGEIHSNLGCSAKDLDFGIGLRTANKPGLPFQGVIAMESREKIRWSWDGHAAGEVAPAGVKVEARGWLQAPGSWMVRGGARATGMEVSALGWTLDFDEVTGSLLFSQGLLHCPDIRLLGASGSLLGNGWFGRGAGAAVVRVALPPGPAAGLGEQLGGIAWRPLDPGSWLYADVTLWLDESGRWRIEFGEGGPVRDFGEWKAGLPSGPSLGR